MKHRAILAAAAVTERLYWALRATATRVDRVTARLIRTAGRY